MIYLLIFKIFYRNVGGLEGTLDAIYVFPVE